ncbi:hypothetical protein JQ634_03900 [Bradyrhizobium sp. AUGA SZCCT0240]|uniref:hypothetical protein n=1 Tax=unclassified Bradyrhizobium TaxID=2631580 RepID=UPI001BAC8DA7|nr:MULTISPECIES: hypothetical protein [unclassified Bradyrhizobium]MBR1192072.1 hypothetical protein [Bradyrhizobium sp. AUGA SZCCT0160]MBR1194443.1 hypothetical protein [Bradyrhizobium sp. AUGA SZCCT0158]MBR1245092.1 hypothetical protein [Bradyrhizobium sp. AUGA SZCCT0274]MBR1251753.1 hypothetical protein [Bradyrhizobium sp. AUGA SZCCT0169]MBR1252837.1 hypothetical protein [Bradyrhizobium sp. AUGA SZCCT0240]
MASNAGIFFAGMGTTFIILSAGFGGGLMMAKSALTESSGYQNRVSAEPPSPARVVLPSTAEAAQPPQEIAAAPQPPRQIAVGPQPSTLPQIQPVKEAQPPAEKQVQKMEIRMAEAEQRERRKRYAERKARWQAERAKRQQQIEQAVRQDAPILAFGGDEHRQSGGSFGN